MKVMTAVGAALLAGVLLSGQANATSGADNSNLLHLAAAVERGQTLPPVGFVRFCAVNPKECQPYSVIERMVPAQLQMSPERWHLLYQVNAYVNSRVKPVTDLELYGVPEHWTYPTTAGDCEDFLLLKKRKLEKLGFPGRALRITVVLQEKGEGHAVLTVTTNEGDFVLDNRRNDILLWNDTNYTFLKRQSADDPKQWVSLHVAPHVETYRTADAEQ
jgi:predicted transglutaminase-like cysteine proteinase